MSSHSQNESPRRSIFGNVLTKDKLSKAKINVIHHFEGSPLHPEHKTSPIRRSSSILKLDRQCSQEEKEESKQVQFKHQIEMHYYYPSS